MTRDISLELLIEGRTIFSSTGKWLHPLFELESFLSTRAMDVAGATIRDKVVGRGSAFLIVRLGIRTVHAGILSRLGKDVLDRAGATCTWDKLVDEIECATEGLLRNVTESDQAYRILADRVRKSVPAEG